MSPRQPRAGGFRLGRLLAWNSSLEGGPITLCRPGSPSRAVGPTLLLQVPPTPLVSSGGP
jgi:hypothetical protein